MAIISKRFRLWERLYDRMLLEPSQDDTTTPRVSEVVVPIIDGDRLLQSPGTSNTAQDLTGAAGTFVAFGTVPRGEEWTLVVAHRSTTVAVSQVVVIVGGGTQRVSVLATGEQVVDLRGITIRQGDQVGMSATADAGDGSITMGFHFQILDLT